MTACNACLWGQRAEPLCDDCRADYAALEGASRRLFERHSARRPHLVEAIERAALGTKASGVYEEPTLAECFAPRPKPATHEEWVAGSYPEIAWLLHTERAFYRSAHGRIGLARAFPDVPRAVLELVLEGGADWMLTREPEEADTV